VILHAKVPDFVGLRLSDVPAVKAEFHTVDSANSQDRQHYPYADVEIRFGNRQIKLMRASVDHCGILNSSSGKCLFFRNVSDERLSDRKLACMVEVVVNRDRILGCVGHARYGIASSWLEAEGEFAAEGAIGFELI
jgi:hypothetical protein